VVSIVTKKVSNLIEAIRQERPFPITEAEARQYRLVGKKTVALMQGLGLIKPPDNGPYPQPAHPLHQSDPELA
jgi:predicted transcriptional regulator